MISPAVRALSASAAIACFLGGVAGLVISSSPFFVIALVAAAILAVPAMFGGGQPSQVDLPRIEADLHRYRSAMLICFAGAAAVFAAVITARGRVAWPALQQLSSLGVSLWLVAFVLMFFVAYYSTQRRIVAR
jgi:hypothetical protein